MYYLCRQPFYQQSTFPTIFGSLRLLRVILLRERVTLLHAHQAFSTLALEACLHGRALGLKASLPHTIHSVT